MIENQGADLGTLPSSTVEISKAHASQLIINAFLRTDPAASCPTKQ